MAILGAAQQGGACATHIRGRSLDRPPRGGQSERHHLYRQGEAAKRRYPLRLIGNDDHAQGCGGDDLFPQQRPSPTLDQAQIGRDLVGTVHREIELRCLVQIGERNPQPLGITASCLRCGHCNHLEPGKHPLRQKLDKMLGGRAAATLNTVFAQEGLPPVPYYTARNLVGGGARSMIERSLEAQGRKFAAAEIDRLVKEFIEYYASHIADRSRPFPSLESALDELGAFGCRLAVCTNKLEWLSVRLLDALGLSNRFVAICGADTFGLRKPHPAFLRRTIARAHGPIASAVTVGASMD